jgi:Uma2 family endonuclease
MATATPPTARLALPDHRDLPDSDGAIVQNFQEHPQSLMLTDSLLPHLRRRFPGGQFCIGQDSGIYWRITDPPLRGVKSPDWFLIVGVPPVLDGVLRRSYVLWQELVAPLVLLEFVSGDGTEERDRTPLSGKFWVYEQAVHAPYYGIYEVDPGRIEMHHLVGGLYQPMVPNDRGRFPLPRLGVELGLWTGEYLGATVPWMRWWDEHGDLLPMGTERAEEERRRAEVERRRAEVERRRAETAEALLRQEQQSVQEERRRAEEERRRAERLAARLRELGLDPEDA